MAAPFLVKEGSACVHDVIKHISYIINLVGEDYVGLGSDFDGLKEDNKLDDIVGIKNMFILEKELKKSGYSEKTINKIMGENWLRVLNQVLI